MKRLVRKVGIPPYILAWLHMNIKYMVYQPTWQYGYSRRETEE